MTAQLDTSKPPADSLAESTEESPRYPYTSLLQQLESKAYQSLPQPGDLAAKDPAELTPWDLSDDALLATLLQEFTNHMVQRTHEVSTEVRKLQSLVNNVGVEVASVQNEFMKSSHKVAMEQVVKQEEVKASDIIDKKGSEDVAQNEAGSDDDDSAAEIARLEEEEKLAIQDGMKALSLFYDHKQTRQASDGTGDELGFDNDDDMNAFDGDDDVIGDNCYFYPSAEGDVFNQRPLPFIVGSSEFMGSSCAGLGVFEDMGGNAVASEK
jgi:hypothetical protein